MTQGQRAETRPRRSKRVQKSSARTARQRDTLERRSTLVVVGDEDANAGIRAALANVDAHIVRVSSAEEVDESVAEDALAFLLCCFDRERGWGRRVAHLQNRAKIPIYALVRDEAPTRLATTLYGAGVAGVFCWPREGLLLARYVVEMLSLRMVRGRSKSPQTALARTVRAHLRQLPVASAPLDVEVEFARVFLSGSVESLSDRDEIEHSISMIPGVTAVDTRGVSVVPLPATDAEILAACKRLIATETSGRTVTASVDAGFVRFRGTAPDRRVAQTLRELAANLRGVREVEIEIEVSPEASKRDRAAHKRIDGLVSSHAAGARVQVSFHRGVAVLEGDVKSLRAKRSLQRLMEQDRAVLHVVNKLSIET